MQKPGFWRLLGAYVIDLIVLLCFNIAWLYLWMWFVSMGIVAKLPNWLMIFGFLGWIFFDVIYFALLEQKGDASLGKRIFKLKIQPLDVPFWKVFVSYFLDCALFVVVGSCIYFYMKHNLISHLSAVDLQRGKIGVEISLKLLGNLFLISAGALFCSPFYFSVCESIFGKTLGKKLMGLQVVQAMQQKQKEETK